MRKSAIITGLILLNICPLLAESVSLKGTVKNSNDEAISGAEVILLSYPSLKTTTDSAGRFSIESTAIQYRSKPSPEIRLSIRKKLLIIDSKREFSHGLVEFFSLNGCKISSISLSKGQFSVPLSEKLSGLVVVLLTTEYGTISETFLCTRSTSPGFSSKQSLTFKASGENNRIRRSAILSDTLIIKKSSYSDKKLPISSYFNHDIVIIMEQESPAETPLAYEREHTGADCPKPSLPAIADLPAVKYLTDPFEWSDKARGRIKTRVEWRCRRAEIIEEIMKYGIGQKPGKPERFTAVLKGNKISVTCGVGNNTINLSATISRPEGAPDTLIPAIIGINTPTGSLPSNIFSSRKIATITFNSDQLAGSFSGGYSDGNFYKLYPNTDAGYMARWAWGVSRLIDALEQLPEAKIDLKRLAISGCSFQGKIALYAGALDERIALTIPHESGGGGTISWRYSDMLEDRDKTEVENLHHAQGASWYSNTLRQFTNTPDKLPYDHHELIALIAPRPVLCIESSQIARMGAEAARIDHLAVRKVYKALGVADRMGATEENTGHCTWHNGFTRDLEAFVDKFLLGKQDVKTDILRSKYTGIDEKTWIPWDIPELK